MVCIPSVCARLATASQNGTGEGVPSVGNRKVFRKNSQLPYGIGISLLNVDVSFSLCFPPPSQLSLLNNRISTSLNRPRRIHGLFRSAECKRFLQLAENPLPPTKPTERRPELSRMAVIICVCVCL